MDPVKRRKWLVRVGYAALALFAFAYFLFAGFPFERILTGKLADFERDSGMHVEMGSMHGGWLFDVVATDVKVFAAGVPHRAGPAAAGEVPEEPTLVLDRVSLSLAPLKLLTGKLGVHFDARLYGGRVKGTVGLGRTATVLDVDVSNVEIAKYTALSTKWGMNLTGQANGSASLYLDDDDGTKSTGKIDLAFKNAAILESNPLGIQKIPKTTFDKGAGVVVVLKDGKAELQDVGLHGEELDLGLEGTVELKKKVAFSTWDARASIKPSDAFKSAVVMLDGFLNPGKGSDGAYHYKLSGTINRLPHAAPDPKK
jgi:type II secretion system protein N